MKKHILYTRVSSIDQNIDRQTVNASQYDVVLIDKISGSIALSKRPEGKKLIAMIENNEVETITVHDISRLGRNVIDILQNIESFTKSNVCVISLKENMRTLNDDGTTNSVAMMILSILGTLAQFELDQIRERQREGIAIAKKNGKNLGRKAGSNEDIADFLNKKKSIDILKYISQNRSHNDIAKLCRCSFSTIIKVRKAAGI